MNIRPLGDRVLVEPIEEHPARFPVCAYVIGVYNAPVARFKGVSLRFPVGGKGFHPLGIFRLKKGRFRAFCGGGVNGGNG